MFIPFEDGLIRNSYKLTFIAGLSAGFLMSALYNVVINGITTTNVLLAVTIGFLLAFTLMLLGVQSDRIKLAYNIRRIIEETKEQE